MIAPGYETSAPEESTVGVLSNRCLLDRPCLTEALRASMRSPLICALQAVDLGLMALFAGLLILAIVKKAGAGPIIEAALLLIMVSYFYIYQFLYLPRRLVKKQILHYATIDGYRDNEIFFFPANVGNRRGEEILHMDYGRIKRVNESARYIVLTTGGSNLIPLDKTRFENGGPEDFWRLLAQYSPKTKVYRRKAR